MQIAELEAYYNADKEANKKALAEFSEASEYYHSYQLPQGIKSVVEARGQVPIIENIFKLIINKILGYKAQSISEIKVSGRQQEDKALSHLLNDLLKVFSEQSEYDREIMKRDLNLILGIGILELWVNADENNDITLSLKAINPLSFIIDKYSIDKNAKDARRFHRCLNLSLQDAEDILGKQPFKIKEDGLYEKRVLIIESWMYENKQWNRYLWYPQQKIYKRELKPFKNNTHPFIISKYHIDDKGLFYGIFREIKPLQDYINFAENRMGNMLGSFKALFESGAVLEKEAFIKSVSLDNSVTEIQPGGMDKIKFLDNKANIQTISAKVQEKRQLAKIISGVNDEVLGQGGTRQSGLAIMQRKEAGLISLTDYLKISDDMDRLLFEKAIDFMQHYFTKKQIFKIVDKKVGERYFMINTNKDNTLKVGKFDLSYKTTLKTTGRDERFAHWSEMFKTIAGIDPQLARGLLPLMLKDTDSPIIADIEELMEQMQAQQEQAQQAQQPINQQLQELQIKEAMIKMQESQAKAKKYIAQSELAQSLANDNTQAHSKENVELR